MDRTSATVDATPKHSGVTLKTNEVNSSGKNRQALGGSKDGSQPAQDSEKAQVSASTSVQQVQVLSIDVECVATGYSHLDRAPCSVAIVNDRCEILFDSLIKPDKSVVSDLFPFTGVRQADLHRAPPFDEVIKKVIDISCAIYENLATMRGT
jgi:DNA polymerase III epsilon subunit-like protein